MSRHYQLFFAGNNAIRKSLIADVKQAACGWRKCTRVDGYWTATNLILPSTTGVHRLNVGVIHIITIDEDGVVAEEASLMSPFYDENRDCVTETIPMIAFIDSDGKRAFVPAYYDLGWL